MEAIQVFVFALVAVAVSYIEERYGRYQDASPAVKQIVNGLLTLITPAVVALVAGWWKPEFGSVDEVFAQLVYLVVPLFVWVLSQVAHQVDRVLQHAGDWLRDNLDV